MNDWPHQMTTMWTKRLPSLFGTCASVVVGTAAYSAWQGASGTTLAVAGTLAAAAFAACHVGTGVAERISQLTGALDAKSSEARELRRQLDAAAASETGRVEAQVAERTAALTNRNADLRAILDTVEQGFVMLDRDGRMSSERSLVLDTWFGSSPEPHERFADFIGRVDRDTGEMIQLGYEVLISEDMPRNVALAALPASFSRDGRHYRLEFTPIGAANAPIASVLATVTDVTDLVAGERADEMRREVHEAFEKALSDRNGFFAFHAEAEEIISGILSGQLERAEERRGIHTLKGNAALFGLRAFGKFCHELEARMLESDAPLRIRDRVALAARWKGATNRLKVAFASRRDRIDIDRSELEMLHDGLTDGASRLALARRVRSWRLEPFEVRLDHFADQARELSERLGKPGLVVETHGAGVRFDPVAWSPFWTAFVHVIRNAVDHGVESLAADRVRAGKPVEGLLLLEVSVEPAHLVLTVADDGPGIDWSRLERRAGVAGLATGTDRDRVQALFADGITTVESASETSGRGLGLAAVRRACARLGGQIEVESTRGAGARFRFIFPRDVGGTVYEGVSKSSAGRVDDVFAV